MLNPFNQTVANQIASAYCNNNDICKAAVFNRLNSLFTDSIFNSFLSTLQSKAYLTANFINEGYLPNNLVRIKFQYMDVVKGDVGSINKILPTALFVRDMQPQNFNALLNIFVPGLQFVTKYPDGTILFFNPSYGYEIAYTGTPVSGGGSGDGGSSGSGSGSGDGTKPPAGTIYTPGKEIVPDQNTQQIIQKQQTSFDVNSLLIPGIAIVAFILLKDKF